MNVLESFKKQLRPKIYALRHDFLNPERVVVLLALLLFIFWTWGAISAMSRNWTLKQRLVSKQRELSLLSLEVETLELENEYYRSEEYQELAARAKHNKKLKGEVLIDLPPSSSSAKNKYQPAFQGDSPSKTNNFRQWLSFLFGF